MVYKDDDFKSDDIKNDDIYASFNAQTDKTDLSEVFNHLFDKNKMYLISELSRDEISLCTRIIEVAKLKKMPSWTNAVNLFITLMISHKRQSRKEIVDTFKGYMIRERSMPMGMGMGRGNR